MVCLFIEWHFENLMKKVCVASAFADVNVNTEGKKVGENLLSF